jgi:hypothetical protein
MPRSPAAEVLQEAARELHRAVSLWSVARHLAVLLTMQKSAWGDWWPKLHRHRAVQMLSVADVGEQLNS